MALKRARSSQLNCLGRGYLRINLALVIYWLTFTIPRASRGATLNSNNYILERQLELISELQQPCPYNSDNFLYFMAHPRYKVPVEPLRLL